MTTLGNLYWMVALGGWVVAYLIFYRAADITAEKQAEILKLRKRNNDWN